MSLFNIQGYNQMAGATYEFDIQALNQMAILQGLPGGYTFTIQALNAIAGSLGQASDASFNITALNRICVGVGGVGAHAYEIDAINELAAIGWPPLAALYATRVVTGGGAIISTLTVQTIYAWLIQQSLYTPTCLLFDANSGMVQRIDGILKYIRTAFDLSSTANNLNGSATATVQPRLVGGIAPNSKFAASNQNGESRYFTHTPISFAAGDAWSVNIMIRSEGTKTFGDNIQGITWNGTNYKSNISISIYGKTAYFQNEESTQVSWGIDSLIGKNILLTLTAYGNGTIELYVNSVSKGLKTVTTNMKFSNYLNGYLGATYYNFFGSSSYYRIQSGAMTAAQVLSESTFLTGLYPEIESTVIGTQTWATRNFEAVCTPVGNVIPEMQAAAAVEKVVNGSFTTDTNWSKGVGWTINTGTGRADSDGTQTANSLLSQSLAGITIGKYHKLTFTIVNRSAGGLSVSTVNINSPVLTADGTYTYIGKQSSSTSIFIVANADFVGSVDNVSIQELGWENATEIYDAVYAATAGDAAQKEYAALKESAMWCYYSNDAALGASYGKQFNGYARKLLKLDLLSASFGWHVSTEAELTTLAANGGNALKYAGTDYWATTGGTNTTAFTALGGASRSGTDGTFATIKETAVFGDDTGLKALTVNHNSDTVSVDTVDIRQGNSIRLIKN
jgi:hypothetical protein